MLMFRVLWRPAGAALCRLTAARSGAYLSAVRPGVPDRCVWT